GILDWARRLGTNKARAAPKTTMRLFMDPRSKFYQQAGACNQPRSAVVPPEQPSKEARHNRMGSLQNLEAVAGHSSWCLVMAETRQLLREFGGDFIDVIDLRFFSAIGRLLSGLPIPDCREACWQLAGRLQVK